MKRTLFLLLTALLCGARCGKSQPYRVLGRVDLKMYYYWPEVDLEYDAPPAIARLSDELKTVLQHNAAPRVLVRVAGAAPDAAGRERMQPCYDCIEEQLMRMGWQVLDRNLLRQAEEPAGFVDYRALRNRTDADLIVEVSWLRFSDPDMPGRLKAKSMQTLQVERRGVCRENYYLFETRKDWEAYRKLTAEKQRVRFRNQKASYDPVERDSVSLTPYRMDEACLLNRNVVSAIYKIIRASDGTIVGTIHVGMPLAAKVHIGSDSKVPMRIAWEPRKGYYYQHPAFKERFYIGDEVYREHVSEYVRPAGGYIIPQTLRVELLDDFVDRAVLPQLAPLEYAARLNNGEDVKITGEKTITDASYAASGEGATRYGYYASYSRGQTHGNSTTTTTQVDAEYIRCADFYECYRPLSQLFVEELQRSVK